MSAKIEAADFKLDPNYAVICSFLEQFGGFLYENPTHLSIEKLDVFLQTENVKPEDGFIKLHLKLLKGIGHITKSEQWEKGLIKFSKDFSERDDKLIEDIGDYTKIPVAAKLRILKNLCEDQFAFNDSFNKKVNGLLLDKEEEGDEDGIRHVPLGKDRQGRSYWYIMDKTGDIRLYRGWRNDVTCEERWNLLCSGADEMKDLIDTLETYERSELVDPECKQMISQDKLLYKEDFVKITEEDMEEILENTKHPHPILYKVPKARTAIEIEKAEKEHSLKHCSIKMSQSDKDEVEEWKEKEAQREDLKNLEKKAEEDSVDSCESKTADNSSEKLNKCKQDGESGEGCVNNQSKMTLSKHETPNKDQDKEKCDQHVHENESSEICRDKLSRQTENKRKSADENLKKSNECDPIDDPNEGCVEGKSLCVLEKKKENEIDDEMCSNSNEKEMDCTDDKKGSSKTKEKNKQEKSSVYESGDKSISLCDREKDKSECPVKVNNGVTATDFSEGECKTGRDPDINQTKQYFEKLETQNLTSNKKDSKGELSERKDEHSVDVAKTDICMNADLTSENVKSQIVNESDVEIKDDKSIETVNDESKNMKESETSPLTIHSFADDLDMKETLMRISELSGSYSDHSVSPVKDSDFMTDEKSIEINSSNNALISECEEKVTKNKHDIIFEQKIGKNESSVQSAKVDECRTDTDTKAFDDAIKDLLTLEEIINQGNTLLSSKKCEVTTEGEEKTTYTPSPDSKSFACSLGKSSEKTDPHQAGLHVKSDETKKVKIEENPINDKKDQLAQNQSGHGDNSHDVKEEKVEKVKEEKNMTFNEKEVKHENASSNTEFSSIETKVEKYPSCSLEKQSLGSKGPSSDGSNAKDINLKVESNIDLDKKDRKMSLSDIVQKDITVSPSKLKLPDVASLQKELKVELKRIDEIFKKHELDMEKTVNLVTGALADTKLLKQSSPLRIRDSRISSLSKDNKSNVKLYSYKVTSDNTVEILNPKSENTSKHFRNSGKDSVLPKVNGEVNKLDLDPHIEKNIKGDKGDVSSLSSHKTEKGLSSEVVDLNKGKLDTNEKKANESLETKKEDSPSKKHTMIVDGDVIEINELSTDSDSEECEVADGERPQNMKNDINGEKQPDGKSKSNVNIVDEKSMRFSKYLAREALKVINKREYTKEHVQCKRQNTRGRPKKKKLDNDSGINKTMPLKPLPAYSALSIAPKVINLDFNPAAKSVNTVPVKMGPQGRKVPQTTMESVIKTLMAQPAVNKINLQTNPLQYLKLSNPAARKTTIQYVNPTGASIQYINPPGASTNPIVLSTSPVLGNSTSTTSFVPVSSAQKHLSALSAQISAPHSTPKASTSLLANMNVRIQPQSSYQSAPSVYPIVRPPAGQPFTPLVNKEERKPVQRYLVDKPSQKLSISQGKDGRYYSKDSGKQFLLPQNAKRVVVGLDGKFYDSRTGEHVSMNIAGQASDSSLKPGMSFFLVPTPQSKMPPKPLNNTASYDSFRGHQRRQKTRSRRGKKVVVVSDSSDSDDLEFEDKSDGNGEDDGVDSDYDYDSLSRWMREGASKAMRHPMKKPNYIEISDEEIIDVTSEDENDEVKPPKPVKKVDEVYELQEYPCTVCGLADKSPTILTCEDCESTYHMGCLSPPLLVIPLDDWFCPQCEHLMLVENLKDKYKALRRLLYSISRKENKITKKMFAINRENIMEVSRSSRTRKEVDYDETKFDKMVKNAVDSFNKPEEKKSTKSSAAKLGNTETESSDHSSSESDTTDRPKSRNKESTKRPVTPQTPNTATLSSRKRSLRSLKSPETNGEGPTETKLQKVEDSESGKRGSTRLEKKKRRKEIKDKEANAKSEKKEEVKERPQRQLRERRVKDKTDAAENEEKRREKDSDYDLSEADKDSSDTGSDSGDTEDYGDGIEKKKDPEEHIYYTSSGRKTNSLSKLKNAF